MKDKLLFLLIFIVPILYSCESSLTPKKEKKEAIGYKNMTMAKASTAKIPPEVKKAYLRDAEVITALYINKKDSTQIKLPTALIDMLFNGFMHIYNSDNKKANEVMQKYKIHRAVMAGASRRLWLRIDASQEWARAWLDGKLMTGNPEIDQLIKKYHLQLTNAIELFTEPDISAEFKTGNPYNQFALASIFNTRKDVEFAGANINIIDGDNIKVEIKKNYIRYEFSNGFGDCMAGCIGRHSWVFNVYSNGRVEFIKEY